VHLVVGHRVSEQPAHALRPHAHGGAPRQLTFYNDVGALPPRGGIDNRVLDWTPDGRHILFNPHRLPWSDRMPAHYVVPFAGGMETALKIPEGSAGSYSADGTKLAYTAIEREFRTWKRYRGGWSPDIFIFDLEKLTSENITNHAAQDAQPMWHGDTIYFISDRGANERHNIWAYDAKTKQSRQITQFTDFDVTFPSMGPDSIVFQAGGRLYLLDVPSGRHTEVPVRVVTDETTLRTRTAKVADLIQTAGVSPTGKRAAQFPVFAPLELYAVERRLRRIGGGHQPRGAPRAGCSGPGDRRGPAGDDPRRV